MYSYEDRIRAVKFYITCGYNAAYTVSKLGYPDASNLKHWYKEYSESNDLHKGRKKVSKFSDREKRDAVDYYFAHDRNALQTVKALGYPSRPLLIQWVKELCPEEGKRRCKSFKSHVRCSQEEKIQAVMESCKGNLKIAQIAEIYGVTPSAVSIWRKELLGEGKTLKMIQPPAEDKSIEQLIREKAELEEMKASYEQQSYDLQCQIDQKKSESADYENEIAYAQQQATEYANLLAEQTAEIQRLEAERIAAEEEARRQAEEEAARQAAEEEAAAKAAEQEQDSESEDEENIEYDEDGNEIENTDDADNESDESESDDGVEYDENGDPVDNAGASDDVEYDEYGNVIDSDNTVSPDDYESEQSSDSDSSSSSGSGSGSSVVDFATQFVGNPYVWGGTSLTGGADCSGFTQSVYANFGVSLPRTSYEQQYAGTEVSYADAQPGDLICYGGHVAIYMGNGRIVHASNSVDGIKISDNAAYRTIVSVRRLV